MTGRTNGAEGARGAASVERLDRGEAGPGREQRGVERGGRGRGVGIDPPTASGARPLYQIDLGRAVHAGQLGPRRRSRTAEHQRLHEVGSAHTIEDRLEPSRPLRMTSTWVVVEVALMGAEEDGHRAKEGTSVSMGPYGECAGRAGGPPLPHYRGVAMSAHRDLTRGDGRLRLASWRGDTTTAYLTPARGRPSAADVERSIDAIAAAGYRAAFTAALGPTDAAPFLEAGFSVHERLHLLARPVGDPPHPSSELPVRRGRRGDHPAILKVDHAAFPPFWQLDAAGLDDALTATPSSRLRVVTDPDTPTDLLAYAVTGRAGSRGYLQRLAVVPRAQRRGIASALVADGLAWLRRWGARELLVNTQEDNTSALDLYHALGFRRQDDGLAVLWRSVNAS